MALSPTKLNDRYTLQRSLDDGDPFAVTYLGKRADDGQAVLIREYFPRHLAERADDGTVQPLDDEETFQLGRRYFLKEGEVLAGIEHSNLRDEQDQFRAHGTAFRVSSYREGVSLEEALEKRDEGSLGEEMALTIVRPVLEALQAVHKKGLLHGGLAPKAVYLTKSRVVLLQGFRSAHLQLVRKTERFEEITEAGLSPPELYVPEGQVGPWTDVYAAAALLYRIVAGERLPKAAQAPSHEERIERLRDTEVLSEGRVRALQQALAPRPEDRVQSARQFRKLLEDAPSTAAAAEGAAAEGDEEETPSPEKKPASEEATEKGKPSASEGSKSELGEAADGSAMWGPAAMAAAAADAAKERKRSKPRAPKSASTKSRSAASRGDRSARRPEEARRSEDEKEFLGLPVSKRLALGVGAALLVVVLGGAALLFTGALGGEGDGSSRARYESLLAEGDSLFDQSDYRAAQQRYEQVRELRPETETSGGRVTERLRKIEQMQQAARKENYERAMRRGNSLKSRADALAEEGGDELRERARRLYEEAEEAYLTAYDNHPNDSLAFAQAQAVNDVLAGATGPNGADGSEEEENQRLYERYRQQGDEALERGEFETARRKFREALDYEPGSAYASNRLEEIRGLIGKAQHKRQYRQYRRRADSLFRSGQFAEARREYRLALDVVPEDDTASTRIKSIDHRLAQQQAKQQQYQYHRGRGDVFFDEGQFQKATNSYEQALDYRPDDSYVKDRIAEAKQKIEAAEKKAAAAEKKAEAQKEAMTEDGVYTVPDEEPVLVGGLAALHKRVEYPMQARQRNVEGRVYLKVTVSETGEVSNVKVLKGIGAGCDREATRTVQQSEFRPATVDGQPVTAYKTLMVQFKIKG